MGAQKRKPDYNCTIQTHLSSPEYYLNPIKAKWFGWNFNHKIASWVKYPNPNRVIKMTILNVEITKPK